MSTFFCPSSVYFFFLFWEKVVYVLEQTNVNVLYFFLETHSDVCAREHISLWRLPPWLACSLSRSTLSASLITFSTSSIVKNAEMKIVQLQSGEAHCK